MPVVELTKQTVLLLGATGKTGSSIADALIQSNQFNLLVATRPASKDKPEIQTLRERGAVIHVLDLDAPENPASENVDELLRGVDIVISATEAAALKRQRPLIDAAKRAGVKRFIPCDFGIACPKGIMLLNDWKLEIQDYIKSLGLGYTFIDVGFWYQISIPIIDKNKEFFPGQVDFSKIIYGQGNLPSAITDLRDIGPFVARIIADERTLNRYVFAHGEHRTQNQVFEMAKRISGKPIEPTMMSKEAVSEMVEKLKDSEEVSRLVWEYSYSVYIRGDNTVENAKKPEYGAALDARELYPDFEPRSLEAFAHEYYNTLGNMQLGRYGDAANVQLTNATALMYNST